jgi:peptidoglycan hydrolase CwlO-like protein
MDAQDSLYGDVDVIGDSAETKKLQQNLEDMVKQLVKKDKEIADLTAQTQAILADKATLETNILALYNTAMAEIKRKDREIAELRAVAVSSGRGSSNNNNNNSSSSSSSSSSYYSSSNTDRPAAAT